MIRKVSIIGGGQIGKAVDYIIANSGVKTSIWDKDSSKASVSSLTECLNETEAIFFCVPSWAVRTALKDSLSDILPSIPLIFVSKGLEAETYLTMPEIATEFIDDHRVVFMGGPMIAEEIMAAQGGHAVFGGQPEITHSLAEIFKGNKISAEVVESAYSVAVLGTLKNIYAIALGAAEGVNLGFNMKARLFSLALEEMNVISLALGGEVGVTNSAGIGDLLATGLSKDSSNHRTGFSLALGENPEQLSEGIISVPALIARLKGNPAANLPLISFIHKMIESHSIRSEDWDKILND